MTGAVAKAEEIAARIPMRYVLLQQFKNPANPAIHEQTTGPEIWEDTDGAIDILVSGVGTGGTITGVSRYIKQTRGKAIRLGRRRAGGQPGADATIAPASRSSPAPHKIQGIGAGFVPEVLDLSLVDAVEQVSNDEAIHYARRLDARGGHPLRHFLRARRRPWPCGSPGDRSMPARPSSSSCPTRASAT